MKKQFIAGVMMSLGVVGFSACTTNSEPVEITKEIEVIKTEADSEGSRNYFVLNRNLDQLKAISLAAGELAKADGDRFGSFQVVICGKPVQELTDAERMAPILELAAANGVQLVACGFSLKKFEVDASAIPSSFKVVDNGILFGFELQKEGAYSITL